jgi:glycerol-3-phosphate acyltransferase PlsX
LSSAIAIDAMGGDRAPREVVRGAVMAARQLPGVLLHLVGRREAVETELASAGWSGSSLSNLSNIAVVDAREVIDMADSPVDAFRRKRGSSIEVALRLVQSGEASAFVSAGNTGACVAVSTLLLRTLPLVKKAGIAVAFHAGPRPVVVCDVGANVETKPEHLLQYGVMASRYAQDILGVQDPRVALLNVGEEDAKGNRLAKVTHALFQTTGLNFQGNVEGVEIFRGACDVVICDGFTGNIVLKVSEGLAERLVELFRDVLEQALVSGAETPVPEAGARGEARPDAAAVDLMRRSLLQLAGKLDYSEFGGAPLLGVNGVVIIAHGRSDAKAVSNAIRVAKRMSEVGINSRITSELESFYSRESVRALGSFGDDLRDLSEAVSRGARPKEAE